MSVFGTSQLLLIILHIIAFANNVASHDRSSYYGLENGEYDGGATYNVLDFGAAGDGAIEDTKALTNAWTAACGNTGGNPTVLLPGGKTFLVKVIEFDGTNCNFSSVYFQIEGQIVAPSSNDWTNCSPNWIGFVNINGLTLDGNGLINGYGEYFWANNRKYEDRTNEIYLPGFYDCSRSPSAFLFQGCNNVQINYINTKNTPGVHFSIKQSTQVEISNVNINAPGNSPNTDGINIVASKNVIIKDTNIATGDDCIAINNGCQFINVTNVACGPGHGISIGSLGKGGSYATVEDVYVKESSFSDTQNGARIKTWEGGSGYARRITFEGMTLTNAGNPIFIDQHYCARSTCEGEGEIAVDISDVSFINVHGTSADREAIKLLCNKGKGCTNIVVEDVDITTSENHNSPAQAACTYVQGTQSKTSPAVPCLRG